MNDEPQMSGRAKVKNENVGGEEFLTTNERLESGVGGHVRC